MPVCYNARGDYASVFYSSTTLLAGFLAVLIGYASSAAIIWQAAIVAGATTAQISGWMTALGLAMGVSTLALTLWYRVPVLTAWSRLARLCWSPDYRD
ncbi:benzoate transporter [Escherichia coli]|uniref:Benzoate transporter n=1 Tax=Escherichia coli TaxID=562 RepID=A0A376MWW8_ECOLX|nr:benzoate transporter [Escherichia coli]